MTTSKYILPAAGENATEYDLPYGQNCTNGRKFKTVDGKYFQLGKKMADKESKGQGIFAIKPVTEKAYRTRKGRRSITDLSDPNPGSWKDYRQNIGRVIHVPELDEYFLVESVSCVQYDYGWHTVAEGRWLMPDVASPLKAAWDASQSERSAAQIARAQAWSDAQ